MIDRDLGDILDRWSIAKLKTERIGTPDNKKEFEEFSGFIAERKKKYPQYDIDQWSSLLVNVNSVIWKLEAAMKSGKDVLPNKFWLDDKRNSRTLTIIGRNSIMIRDINGIRVGLKNMINKIVSEGFIDIKQNHMSE